MIHKNWLLPQSPSFCIADTSESGRCVFANSSLETGEDLLTTTVDLSPLAHVILRPYRREVCAQCFAYDRGREWKIRDLAIYAAFCSEDCQQQWRLGNDELSYQAITSVETFIKAALKRQKKAEPVDLESSPRTEALEIIEDAWKAAEASAIDIIAARRAHKISKPQRAALRAVTDLSPDPDILTYVLSGVLAAYKSQKSVGVSSTTVGPEVLLPSLYSLATDATVFLHTPTTTSPLEDYTSSYLVLLAILPIPLLDFISSDLIINLASRASHNAFSIRPEGNSDGDQSGEFLGWGVWPEASFFNHSCRPNVRKERRGRQWSFYVRTDEKSGVVNVGDQLCITYLGGDERDLCVKERRERLLSQWGFRCRCDRCVEESSEQG